jgi:hypothetical protein
MSPSSSLEYPNLQTPSRTPLDIDDYVPWKQEIVQQVNRSPLLKYFAENPSNTSASAILLQEIYKLEHLQSELAHDANRALEAVQKEVECLRLAQSGMNEEACKSVAKLQAEINEIYETQVSGKMVNGCLADKDLSVEDERRKNTSLKDEIQRIATKEKQQKLGEATEEDRVCLDKLFVDMRISVEELAVPKMTPLGTPLAKPLKDNANFSSIMNALDVNHQVPSSSSKTSFTLDEKMPSQAGRCFRKWCSKMGLLKSILN